MFKEAAQYCVDEFGVKTIDVINSKIPITERDEFLRLYQEIIEPNDDVPEQYLAEVLDEVVHNLKEFIRKRGCIELDEDVMANHKDSFIMYAFQAIASYFKIDDMKIYDNLSESEQFELAELYRMNIVDTRAIDWSPIEKFLIQYNILIYDEYDTVTDEEQFKYIDDKFIRKLSTWFADEAVTAIEYAEFVVNNKAFMDELVCCLDEKDRVYNTTLASKLISIAKFVENTKGTKDEISEEHERYLYAAKLKNHDLLSEKAFNDFQYQFNQFEVNK